MATIEQFAQRQVQPQERSYRTPPHNIEAEQALLGAILVNNEAFYRVSDFLEGEHFHEDLHRRIFEVARPLIKAGKVATPITLKTFLGDHDLGGLTVPQYLARLADEATTVINAEDYGRTVYDLPIRRSLIAIGEDLVNVAYDAPVDSAPARPDRGGGTAPLRACRDRPLRRRLPALLGGADAAIDMAAAAFKREGKLSGIATGLNDLDRDLGGLQPSDLVILAGRPAMGKTSLATNIAFNIAKTYAGERLPTAASGPRTAASSASSPSKCRRSSWRRASSPSNRASPPTRSGAAISARTTSTRSPRPRE